jgi:acetyl-CoA carboxylase biotin carboxyl carrier protein
VTSGDAADALHAHTGVASHDLSALLSLVARSDVVELDVQVGSTRLSLRRALPISTSPVSLSTGASGEATSVAITSPLVGIFRAAVGVGESLEAGQSIGSVEALGLPTNVEAPEAGTVESVLVDDGMPVEYGQPLLVVRRGA